MRSREAPVDDLQKIPDRRPGGAGDHADDPRQFRDRPFAFRGEEPLRLQFFLQFLEAPEEVALTGDPQRPDGELVLTLRRIDRQFAVCFDPGAVGDVQRAALVGGAEPAGAQLALRILERQIYVPGAVDQQRADFAGHPERHQRTFDEFADGGVDLGHAPDRFFPLAVSVHFTASTKTPASARSNCRSCGSASASASFRCAGTATGRPRPVRRAREDRKEIRAPPRR